MAKTVNKRCKHCGDLMVVRAADVARGWGKFCSKRCKARDQERRTRATAAYYERRARRDASGCYEDDF